MSVRAQPDAMFRVLVCEALIPPTAAAASLADRPLPVPRRTLAAIAAFGDTGCRLKASKVSGKGKDADDDEDSSKFQDCTIPSKWPFAQLAESVAAAKPDLVIQVGDYLYRQSACPPGDAKLRAQPVRRRLADLEGGFLRSGRAGPAGGAMDRGAGQSRNLQARRAGYFRLLDPTPAQAPPPCIDVIPQFTVSIGGQAFIVFDLEQRRRQMSLRSDRLRRAIRRHATGGGHLAPHPPADLGLPLA